MISTLRKFGSRSLSYGIKPSFSSTVGGLLNARLDENQLRNAVRYESQGKTWAFQDLDKHSNAVAYGLSELGYKKGDKVVLWIDKTFTCELTTAQLGLAKLGATIVPFDSTSRSDLEKVLRETEARGIIFSPNTKSGESRRADIVSSLFPEIANSYLGTPLKSSAFPKLRNIIHTGFNSIPGTLKYKQILVYGNSNFQTNSFTEDAGVPVFWANGKSYSVKDLANQNQEWRQKNSVGNNDSVVLIGNAGSPAAFAYGIYNTLAHGNYTTFAGNESFKTIVDKLAFQKPSHVIIADTLDKQDLQIVAPSESVQSIKNIAVSGTDAGLVRNVFGGKEVNSYSPYFA